MALALTWWRSFSSETEASPPAATRPGEAASLDGLVNGARTYAGVFPG